MKLMIRLSLCGVILAVLFSGCGTSQANDTFVMGTTAYSTSNANAGLDPHSDYSGWSTVRYGVGETLFKYSQEMEPQPWLAKEYKIVDENTWEITLQENVYFSSGRLMDAEAVKQCFENLVDVHDRAPYDLKIDSISAVDYTLTIKTAEPVPTLINYLSDPYGAIIDMDFGITEDQNVAGTGPFVAVSVSDTEISLEANDNYWGGEVATDKVVIKSITDSDSLTLSLLSGELDAVQGLPYAGVSQFSENSDYKISSADTSRTFFTQSNMSSKPMQDDALRKAISMSIDKEGFSNVLLSGNGNVAKTPFPTLSDNFDLTEYDLKGAKELLAQAGYEDSDGDGYLEKDGQKVVIRWLTYPSRHELPLLAEMVQANLKEIGIAVEVNSTINYLDYLVSGEWDIYASAFITAPTGDYGYFFTTHTLQNSSKNRGGYYKEEMETLNDRLSTTFDALQRNDIASEMTQLLLDDNCFMFISHLRMNIVMQDNVSGLIAHPSDYYEITADLSME